MVMVVVVAAVCLIVIPGEEFFEMLSFVKRVMVGLKEAANESENWKSIPFVTPSSSLDFLYCNAFRT